MRMLRPELPPALDSLVLRALSREPETVEALPAAPYGQSKFCAERYVNLYGRLHSVRAATARFANVYGPRQDPLGEAGRRDGRSAHR